LDNYDRDDIVIQVSSKEAPLVMNLRIKRPGRDTRGIRLLLSRVWLKQLKQFLQITSTCKI
jgi:hypothetical protein